MKIPLIWNSNCYSQCFFTVYQKYTR